MKLGGVARQHGWTSASARRAASVLAVMATCVGVGSLCASCSRPPEQASAPRPALERTYRVGKPADPDLAVVVTVDRLEITPADHVTLTIDALAKPGTSLELPELTEKLGDFTIAPASEAAPASGSHR